MTTLQKWEVFWRDKSLPMHREDSEEHYRRYSSELRILFDGAAVRRVLEIGCGNGALYAGLGFDQTEYKGVDFSKGMVEAFQAKHPGIPVECADGSAYRDENQYDLIFSSEVVQYFSQDMLRQHFANARAMLAPGGLFVCSSIPWKRQRFNNFSKEMIPPYHRNLARGYLSSLTSLFRPGLGNWFNFRDFQILADEQNMSVEFYGSMFYMYRFHAVMKMKSS